MQRLLPTSLRQLRRPTLTLTQLRIIYSIVAVVALICIAIAATSIFRNSIKNSDDCLWSMADYGNHRALIVSKVMPGGNADRAGVIEGDRVLAINGIRIPDTIDITLRAQKILDDAPSGVPISYMVEREGQVLDLRIVLTKQPIFIQFVVPAFALLWLVIGMIVVISQPRGLVQRRFFFTAVAVSFAFSFPGDLVQTGSGWGHAELVLRGQEAPAGVVFPAVEDASAPLARFAAGDVSALDDVPNETPTIPPVSSRWSRAFTAADNGRKDAHATAGAEDGAEAVAGGDDGAEAVAGGEDRTDAEHGQVEGAKLAGQRALARRFENQVQRLGALEQHPALPRLGAAARSGGTRRT